MPTLKPPTNPPINAPKRRELFPKLGKEKTTSKLKVSPRVKRVTNTEIKQQRFEAIKPEPQKLKYFFELKPIKQQPDERKYTCHFNGYLVGLNLGGEHAYFKKLFCGKEWCPCCQEDGSIIHQRRISRIFPKIMPLEQVGYLVVTIPSGLRENFYNLKALKDFKEYWKRKVKREIATADNNTRGLIRYHWAGEDGTTWKPHLNILINKGFISPQLLERWRHDLKFWFKNYFKLEKAPAPNLFYRYTSIDGEKYHKIKYITRATMLNFPDIKTKDFFLKDLKNFKNTTLFGKFPKCKPLEKDEQKIYLHNRCAITGEPITWKYYVKDVSKVISKKYLEDKGLGIFYAETIYTSFKENEAISNLGKIHKPPKINLLVNFSPGEILKTWFPDKYIFLVDEFLKSGVIFYKKIKPLIKCNKIAL